MIPYINILRVVAGFFVVLLHVSGDGFDINDDSFQRGAFNWLVSNGYNSITRWSVPIFVMIGGALAIKPRNSDFGAYTSRRIRRILIPLVAWSLIYLTYRVVFRGLNFNGFVYNLFISGKPFYHLWYFYMLLGLTALTPLLSSLRKSYGNKLMAWMSIVALTLFVIVPPFSEFTPLVRVGSVPPYLVWFMPYLGYYCLGSFLANTEIRVRSSVLWLVVMMSLTITVWGVYAFGRSFHSYLALNTILLSVSLFCLFKRITLASAHASRLQRLAGTTLGIYLIHPLVLEIIDMTGISVKSIDATFAIPLITIVGWAASYVLTLLLLRSRYLKLMVQ